MNRLFAATFALTLLFWGAIAHAALPARPEGPVYDGAGVIPDITEAQIDSKLRALSKETGKTLVVATVPSLDDMAIEQYAVELYENWGIGDAEKDEGALILVAPNERRTRIEVGLGSEGILPDALAGRIIDQQMIPLFKAGDYGGGIAAAADAVAEQLRREPTDAKAVAAAAERAARQNRSDDDGEIGMVIFWLFVFFFFILPVIVSFARGGRKYRGKRQRRDDDDDDDWGGPVIIWGGSGGGHSWGGSSGSSWGGGGFGGGGGGFGGFGGGMSGGGGASGGW
jgi:uncharacterized protein